MANIQVGRRSRGSGGTGWLGLGIALVTLAGAAVSPTTGATWAQEGPAPDEVIAPITPGVRPYSQIDRDLDAFIVRESRAESDVDRMSAIEDLCRLYEELKRDPRLGRSETLQGYRAKLAGRLQRIESRLAREMDAIERREQREAAAGPTEGEPRVSAATRGGFPTRQASLDQATQAWVVDGRALSDQIPLLAAGGGGPATLLWRAAGRFGGGSVRDYGDDLVSLIQSTIQPDFWDVNGGQGSILFYRPLNALVVRATSEVHGDVGGLLKGLRDAGR